MRCCRLPVVPVFVFVDASVLLPTVAARVAAGGALALVCIRHSGVSESVLALEPCAQRVGEGRY